MYVLVTRLCWKMDQGGWTEKVRLHKESVGSDSLGALRLDPGQTPLEVGQHELESFGPLLFAVELGSASVTQCSVKEYSCITCTYLETKARL